MMAAIINRKQLKQDMKNLLANAQVSPKAMTALYLGIILVMNLVVDVFAGDTSLLSTFISILSSLVSLVLFSGFALYCMAVRRGERAEFLTLFDGFSFVGKIIALNVIMYAFIMLWSMLFGIPGIIASYRYRFALFNLYENPGISVMEALNMSKRQTYGYKTQLLMLDLSYVGWTILSSIPSFVYSLTFYQELLAQSMTAFGVGTISVAPIAVFSTRLLPVWIWTLIMDLWQLVVAMFYLPTYQCVELGYFDIAKSTSGVGAGASPHHQNPWSDGPDNMGGF